MVDASHDQVDQVVYAHQAAAVIHGPERQRHAAVYPAHHALEVGFDAWPINQYRADHHHLHASGRGQLVQTLLCFVLGDAIGILGCRQVVCTQGLARLAEFTVDLDRTDEDKAPHAGCCRLTGQAQGTFDIDTAKLGQAVGGGFLHHMHARCGMHHCIDTGEGRRPIG